MPGTSFTSDFDRLIVSWLVGYPVEDVERELILRTLAFHRGCRSRAARDLKISVRALRNKITAYKALGISVPSPGQHPPPFKAVGPLERLLEWD
jgi:hypothetical protein